MAIELLPMPADPGDYLSEKKRRAAAKRKRNAELHERATSDMRRLKTYLKLWIAYVRLARDKSHRRGPITVTELCNAAGISEAAFHKNFPAGTEMADPGGIDILMLAMVDRISKIVIREVRREIGGAEDLGETISQSSRVTVAVSRLVDHITRYPHLFHVEGVLPREVIYSLSDALGDAIIWNGPATLQERADAVAMAKYHTTALIGIMRSSLGEDAARDRFIARVTYVMVSQIVPALVGQQDSHVRRALDRKVEHPVELNVTNSKGYKTIEAVVDTKRLIAALRRRNQSLRKDGAFEGD